MGCAGSRFDNIPVTGHPSGLAVIPATNNGFLRSEPTILKLREKILSWSGDDCSVKVLISVFLACTQMSFIAQPMAESFYSVKYGSSNIPSNIQLLIVNIYFF